MIEMSRPEDVLTDPQAIAIAKGEITVEQARKMLHERVGRTAPISISEIAEVNTSARMEAMKQKTRELMAVVSTSKNLTNDLLLMIDMFDCYAMDWVYSDRLKWEGSIADSYADKIIAQARL